MYELLFVLVLRLKSELGELPAPVFKRDWNTREARYTAKWQQHRQAIFQNLVADAAPPTEAKCPSCDRSAIVRLYHVYLLHRYLNCHL